MTDATYPQTGMFVSVQDYFLSLMSSKNERDCHFPEY